MYYLRRGDVAFFRGQSQLTTAQWPIADRVEVEFRGSKGAQFRKAAIVALVWVSLPRRVDAGGGVSDIMIGLLSCYLFRPPSASSKRWRLCGHYLRWRVCVRRIVLCTP